MHEVIRELETRAAESRRLRAERLAEVLRRWGVDGSPPLPSEAELVLEAVERHGVDPVAIVEAGRDLRAAKPALTEAAHELARLRRRAHETVIRARTGGRSAGLGVRPLLVAGVEVTEGDLLAAEPKLEFVGRAQGAAQAALLRADTRLRELLADLVATLSAPAEVAEA
ncbi:MAG: hypothetical protein RIG82_09155 [Phycisphaeraceae bacterium]